MGNDTTTSLPERSPRSIRTTLHRQTVNFETYRRPSTAVIESLEAATGIDGFELPPLCDAVDPDALDTLITAGDRHTYVEFEHGGVAISVSGNGEIVVADPGT